MDKLERRSGCVSGMLRPTMAFDGLEETCVSKSPYQMAAAVKGGHRSCRHAYFSQFGLGVRKVITRSLIWVHAGEIEEPGEDVQLELDGRAAHGRSIYAMAGPSRTGDPRTSCFGAHHGTSFPV